MAEPGYTTDLQTINLAQDTGSWDELDDWAGGGTIYTDETDYYIQGGNCSSQLATKTGAQDETSLIVDYGSDLSASFTSGICVFMWHVFLPANALDTFANGGTRLIVAADVTEFDAWKTGGKDFGRNPYGGWQNVAVDPTFPPDYQDDGAVGNGGVYRWFGGGVYLLAAIGKGAPHGVDAIRYGRGNIIVSEGTVSTPCNFIQMAQKNDDPDLRWGLFQEQAGIYLWKGLMTIGTATSAAYFDDENINITIDDTPRTYPDFNKIEIRNSSSNVYWTNINFAAVNAAGLSVGRLVVVNNATFILNGCSFTDMNELTFQSNSDINGTTFRRCDLVTQGGAPFDGCSFSVPSSAVGLLVNSNLETITNCDFISDGTGHAIELTASGDGGLTFDGNTFSQYASADGSTGNEALYNNSGGNITINLQNTTSIPSIRNGVGSNTSVQLAVTLTLSGIVSGSEVRIQTARGINPSGAELFHVETTTGADVEWTYNFSDFGAEYLIDIIMHHVEYTHLRIDDLELPDANSTIPIQQSGDRWYANPIITKTETFGKRPTDTWQTWVDSYMDSDNPTLKYNTEESLLTYLSVDIPIFSPKIGDSIIPSFSTVNSAKIWLYIYANDQTGSEGAAAKLLRRNWVTTEVTWNEWSNGNAWTTGGGTDTTDDIYGSSGDITIVGAGQTGWVSWTVTDDIQDWLDGTYPNLYGWLIIGGGIGGLGWEARSSNYLANTSLRPYLSINWTQ